LASRRCETGVRKNEKIKHEKTVKKTNIMKKPSTTTALALITIFCHFSVQADNTAYKRYCLEYSLDPAAKIESERVSSNVSASPSRLKRRCKI
jgi:hypothetical protein